MADIIKQLLYYTQYEDNSSYVIVDDRVYFNQAPQNATKPYVVVSVINEREHLHSGKIAGTNNSIYECIIQFSIYANNTEDIATVLTGWRRMFCGVRAFLRPGPIVSSYPFRSWENYVQYLRERPIHGQDFFDVKCVLEITLFWFYGTNQG